MCKVIDLESDNSENCIVILSKCYEIISQKLFNNGHPVSCSLFEDKHMSLACNMASSICDIRDFLESLNMKNSTVGLIHIKLYITLLFYLYQVIDEIYSYICNDSDFLKK